MQAGDLVKSKDGSYKFVVGIVTRIEPEISGFNSHGIEYVEVAWSNGNIQNHSAYYLELISASR